MQEYEQTIFISYAWGDEREKIVNQIDQALQKRGIKITRDKRDLGYKGSIKEFMERIGQGNCVIVVISDKYLRSENCMFELVEIAENKQFQDRIFPVILADANIYKAARQLEYIKYWEQQIQEIKDGIKGVDPTNLGGIYAKLNLYDHIRDKISDLIAILSEMNTLTPEMHQDSNFSTLYDAIVKRMQNTPEATADARPNEKPATKKERKTMDPITLAAAATALLAPFIKKAGEKALDKIAEQLPQAVGKVWSAIANKSSITEAASDLAKNPEDADNEVFFKKQLQKAFEKDQDFASQLADLIEEAKKDSAININGDGVVATNNSTAVGKISIGGNMNGNFVIGNNNKVNDN